MCGGTDGQAHELAPREGLSPRVRGNHGSEFFNGICLGSIPACAGEPYDQVWVPAIPKVYPRVCGGTFRFRPTLQAGLGLSPRVRGNPAPISAVS